MKFTIYDLRFTIFAALAWLCGYGCEPAYGQGATLREATAAEAAAATLGAPVYISPRRQTGGGGGGTNTGYVVSTNDFVLNQLYTNVNAQAFIAESFYSLTFTTNQSFVILMANEGNGFTTISEIGQSNLAGAYSLATLQTPSGVVMPNAVFYFTNQTVGSAMSTARTGTGRWLAIGGGSGGGSGNPTTNASLLVTGTLADARLSANVPLLNGANNYTGSQSYGATTIDSSGDVNIGSPQYFETQVFQDSSGSVGTIGQYLKEQDGAGGNRWTSPSFTASNTPVTFSTITTTNATGTNSFAGTTVMTTLQVANLVVTNGCTTFDFQPTVNFLIQDTMTDAGTNWHVSLTNAGVYIITYNVAVEPNVNTADSIYAQLYNVTDATFLPASGGDLNIPPNSGGYPITTITTGVTITGPKVFTIEIANTTGANRHTLIAGASTIHVQGPLH